MNRRCALTFAILCTITAYTVLDADCGKRALDVWQSARQPIDLLLTDMVMPDGNQRRRARQDASQTPREPQSPLHVRLQRRNDQQRGSAGRGPQFSFQTFSAEKLVDMVHFAIHPAANSGKPEPKRNFVSKRIVGSADIHDNTALAAPFPLSAIAPDGCRNVAGLHNSATLFVLLLIVTLAPAIRASWLAAQSNRRLWWNG